MKHLELQCPPNELIAAYESPNSHTTRDGFGRHDAREGIVERAIPDPEFPHVDIPKHRKRAPGVIT